MNTRRIQVTLQATRRRIARAVERAIATLRRRPSATRPADAPDASPASPAFERPEADSLQEPEAAPFSAAETCSALATARRWVLVAAAVGAVVYAAQHPPLATVPPGHAGLRTNQLTGQVDEFREGRVLALPGLHVVRLFALRDQTLRPARIASAEGPAPLQSVEGLSLGADLAVRFAIDPQALRGKAAALPADVAQEIVDPAVQGVIYKVFARFTVREIFSTRRVEIQQAIESELRTRLAADGLLLRSVTLGKIDLPADYKRGMETLLSEELASEKMRYTLELKDKRVKETELEASAEKVRREVAAEAAAREQVIAARAQEEAMKHVLPFKQRQIEQRQLEAEAEKQARVKAAEASAQARRIEAQAEADARQKLAEAEAFRVEKVGRANAEQMGREGRLVTQHPLLIQKTLADKLSDKIQVIIAPPPSDGSFIASALVGGPKPARRATAGAGAGSRGAGPAAEGEEDADAASGSESAHAGGKE